MRVSVLAPPCVAAILLAAGIHAEGPVDLAAVNDFAYQLQGADPEAIRASRFDLVVVDRSRDGSDAGAWTPAEVARMREKPGGGRRIVLAYCSIGEAEDYRGYWKPEWKRRPPEWLGPENLDWEGNFKVKFWHPEWQRRVLGGDDALLDRILKQGFDGIYLDIIDAFEYWQERGVPDAAERMVAFVGAISAYAKGRHPGFLVFPQNGEALAERDGYLAAVDGIGREDVYTLDDASQRADETAEAERGLDAFVKAGKQVLVIEYCRSAPRVRSVYERARKRGYVPYCTVRALDRLTVNRGWEPD